MVMIGVWRRVDALALLGLAWLVVGSAALAGSLTAELDRNQGTMEDSFVLTITVEGRSEEPSLPRIDGLEIQSAGRSSQTQIINGSMSSQVQYRYLLVPSAEGRYTLPAIKLKVDGKLEQAPALVFDVVKQAATSSRQTDQIAFVRRDFGAREMWEGESVGVSLRLHYRARVQLRAMPDVLTGAWQRLETGRKREPKEYRTTINGVGWNVYEIREVVTPLKTGRIEVPGARVGLAVEVPRKRRSSGSPFDDFFGEGFFGRAVDQVPLNLVSDPVTITVKPLPTAGRPADFSGLVGSWAIKSSLSASSVNVGENATLTVVIEGDGLVDRVVDVAPTLPAGFKSYADKPVVERSESSDGRLSGRKTFKFAIVPVEPGTFTIPEQRLVYFDTSTGTYVTRRSSALTLQVSGSAAVANEGVAGATPDGGGADRVIVRQESVKELGSDLLPSKSVTYTASRRWPSGGEWIALAILWGVMPLGWMGLHWRDHWGGGVEGRRRRRAERGALRQLRRELTPQAGESDTDAAARALGAFRRFLSLKMGDRWLSVTGREARARLMEVGIPESTVLAVVALIGDLEAVQFGASGTGAPRSAGLVERVMGMARDIERGL